MEILTRKCEILQTDFAEMLQNDYQTTSDETRIALFSKAKACLTIFHKLVKTIKSMKNQMRRDKYDRAYSN